MTKIRLNEQIGRDLPMIANPRLSLSGFVRAAGISLGEENFVGARVPTLEGIEFDVVDYSLISKPAWVDSFVRRTKDAIELRTRLHVAERRLAILEVAMRRTTQRVNLFERILIPTPKRNIKRIQLADWYRKELRDGSVEDVKALIQLLHDGDSIHQTMQVTGEEGISLADFITWQKAVYLDMVYLQQDAFDSVDARTPMERQVATLALTKRLIDAEYTFTEKDDARNYFTRLTGLQKNLNYSELGTPNHENFLRDIEALAKQHAVHVPEHRD